MRQARGSIAVIGGGPSGLMAAEAASAAGCRVDVYEAMPSCGRKLLRAGIGGLNLTHSDVGAELRNHYTPQSPNLVRALNAFDSRAVRRWAHGLGIETFVGSSGRVFPKAMKAAPLLRRWLQRLRLAGVQIHPRHRWLGWSDNHRLRFATTGGELERNCDALVLACGGGSWPQLGSDGQWQSHLHDAGVELVPLEASNCGFEVAWSEHARARFEGVPLKPVALSLGSADGEAAYHRGEFVLTRYGVEGGLIYTLSKQLRDAIASHGSATIRLDLAPDRSVDAIYAGLERQKPTRSLSEKLRRAAGLDGVKATLFHELSDKHAVTENQHIAAALKALPLVITRARPLAEAISSAGGVSNHNLDPEQMLKRVPGVFIAGEMLDWDAPTGGYLLTACLATGRLAGQGAASWLAAGRKVN